ncbi:MAG: pyruvate dehydrogenase (acetyl-transferring) E1 component subunit alpha [Pseudomonadales bacterium]|jgi:pyruvate dehydrogenase E1 component alpha subunit
MDTEEGLRIHHTAVLGPDGRPRAPMPPGLADAETLTGLYRHMVRARLFDAKAITLQRTGRLGTYASLLGQEAVGVGVGWAMRADDVLLPSFREHALQMVRGVPPDEILRFWGGDERGSAFESPAEDFPVCITVGSHAPQAVGVALAFRLRDEPRAAVCVLGDGATSKGDFYEALNAAGVWQLPFVCVVTNNEWAISMPRQRQTAAETLAQKAVAAGMHGEQVDGNDVVAVAQVVGAALERARTGSPSLVECLTYRLGDHTTVDDASRYRADEEVSRWWEKDPIARLRLYLAEHAGWDKSREEALLAECNAAIDEAAQRYLDMPPEPPAAMFEHLFERLPEPLESQRQAVTGASTDG